jgi:hypothetical protein
MGGRRILKKVYCDKEGQEKNVVALELVIEEQNVIPL